MADGYVIIDTQLKTDGVSKGVSVIEREITKTTASIEKQRAKLQEYYDELNRIHESTDAMLELANTTEQVNAILELEQGEVDRLNEKYAQQLQTLARAEELLEGQKTELEMAKDAVAEQAQEHEELGQNIEEETENAEEMREAFEAIPQSIGSSNNQLHQMNTSLKDAIKKVIKYGVGVGGALALFNKLKSAAMDGLNQIAEQDAETKAALDTINAAMNQIKISLGGIIAPLVQVLAPVLTWISNIVTDIANAFRWLFAIIRGDNSYKKIQKLEDYYAGVDESAQGASAAVKEMQRNLSGLDEINTWEKQNAALGGGGGGGGGLGSSGSGSGGGTVDVDVRNTPVADLCADILKILPDFIFDYDKWEGIVQQTYGEDKDVEWLLNKAFENPLGTFGNVVDYMNEVFEEMPEWLQTLLAVFNPGFVGITKGGEAALNNGGRQYLNPETGEWVDVPENFVSLFEKADSELSDAEKQSLEYIDKLPEWIRSIFYPGYKSPTERAWSNNKTYQYERNPITGATTGDKKEYYKTPAEKAWEQNKTYQYERDPVTGQTLGEKKKYYKNSEKLEKSFFNKTRGRFLDLEEDGKISTQNLERSLEQSLSNSEKNVGNTLDTFYDKTRGRFLDIETSGKSAAGNTATEAQNKIGDTSRTLNTFYNDVKEKYLDLEESANNASNGSSTAVDENTNRASQSLETFYNKTKGNYLNLEETAESTAENSANAAETAADESAESAGNATNKASGSINTFYNKTKGRFLNLEETAENTADGSENAVTGATNEASGSVDTFYNKTKDRFLDIEEDAGTSSQNTLDAIKEPFENNTLGDYFDSIGKEAGESYGTSFEESVQGAAKSLGDTKDSVASAFGGTWEEIKKQFPQEGTGKWFANNVGNPIAEAMRKALNLVIKYINLTLSNANSTITGQKNLIGAQVAKLQLLDYIPAPALATGAVIPPNAPFTAILGDQRNGTNLETPENLLRQIVREESGRGAYEFVAQINRKTLFDEMIDEAKIRKSVTGGNPFELG